MATIDTQSLTQILSAYAGVTEEEAAKFLEAFSSVVASNVKKCEDVEVQGLGKFCLIDTHSEMRRVALILADSIKSEVNAPFSFLEPFVISKGCAEEDSKIEKIEELVEEEISQEEMPEIVVVNETAIVDDSEANQDVEQVVEPPVEDNRKELGKGENAESNEDMLSPKKKSFKFVHYILLAVIVLLSGFGAYILFKGDVTSPTQYPEQQDLVETKSTQQYVKNDIQKSQEVLIDSLRLDSLEKARIDTVAIVKNDSVKKSQTISKGQNIVSVAVSSDLLSYRMKDEEGKYVTVRLESGERLTLISLRYFGSKDFWPYIFDVNSDKLKTPSNVIVGQVLYLPDTTYFNIDANNEESLRQARLHGQELIKKQ